MRVSRTPAPSDVGWPVTSLTTRRAAMRIAPLRELDLPPRRTARPAEATRHAVGDDDRGGGFAAQLAELLHRLLDGHLHALAELLDRFGQIARVDLEGDRQHAARRQHLGLADVESLAVGVHQAVRRDRREEANRPHPTVGEDLL